MLTYAVQRLGLGLGIMLTISIGVFILMNTAIDPAVALAGEGASSADIERVRESYGFDRPLALRYVEWLGQVAHGDFGVSYRQQRPVLQIVTERFPVTFLLACLSLLVALAIALPLAALGALKPDGLADRFAIFIAYIGQSMPSFWFGLVGMLIFGINLAWLPVSGSASLAHFVLPALTLGFYSMPTLLRLTRAGLIEVLASDYIRTARAKGLSTRLVVWRHSMRNAIIPVVSVASVQFGYMLAGSVLVETIFAMRGIGYLAWEAVINSDLPVIQAIVLMTSFFYVVLTLVADVLNAWLDPRLR